MSYFLVAQNEMHVYYFVNQLPKLTSPFKVRRQMNSLSQESLYNDQSKFIVGRTFNPVAWNSGTGLRFQELSDNLLVSIKARPSDRRAFEISGILKYH